MTKKTFKNRIQKILSENTQGFFADQYWQPIHNTFKALRDAGYDVINNGNEYQHNEDGVPVSKKWLFTVIYEEMVVICVINAHGAGSVADPLDRYDISAYCC